MRQYINFYHQESKLIFWNRLQVWDSEGLWELSTLGQGFSSFYGSGEALKPGPFHGVPGRGVREAALMVRGHRGVAEQLVQVQPHGQRCQALHVGTVNQLVSTHHMGLQGSRERKGTPS